MTTARSSARVRIWSSGLSTTTIKTTGRPEYIIWSNLSRAKTNEWHWYFEVTDSTGKVVLRDDCRDYTRLRDEAIEALNAVRVIENAGHRLPHSFNELVEKVKAA